MTLNLAFNPIPNLRADDMANYLKLKAGDETQVQIRDLHPTQFRVGRAEVKEKRDHFETMSAKDFKNYLKDHPCPVVIGPGGVPYVTDEQHRANAAEEAEDTHHDVRALREHGHPTMYMKVVANWSDLTPAEFAARMVRSHNAYLFDRGVERPFNELPTSVDDMKNDPYRSLAGFLERKAFKMADVNFIQFKVAEWLRSHLKLSDDKLKDLLKSDRKAILKKTATLLQSSTAKSQPWYLDPKECETKLTE